MKKNFPMWKCQRCHTLATRLLYCSSCLNVVCNNCYDPFVDACRDCVHELFIGNRTKVLENIFSKVENEREAPLEQLAAFQGRCKECYTPLIVTPDRTRCCPRCGLVVGKGYSWLGGSNPGGWSGVIDNVERLLEERVSKQGWG